MQYLRNGRIVVENEKLKVVLVMTSSPSLWLDKDWVCPNCVPLRFIKRRTAHPLQMPSNEISLQAEVYVTSNEHVKNPKELRITHHV